MIGIIYKLTSPSGKIYIGQTIDFNKRMLSYKRKDCKSQPALYNAINRYGFESFAIDILIKTDEFENRQELKEYLFKVELENILKFNSLNNKYGYNIAAGGGYYVDIYNSNKQTDEEKEINIVEDMMFESYLQMLGFYNKKVYQFKDGVLVNSYTTARDAAKDNRCSDYTMCKLIKENKSYKGYNYMRI